jgi:hypothetical protein
MTSKLVSPKFCKSKKRPTNFVSARIQTKAVARLKLFLKTSTATKIQNNPIKPSVLDETNPIDSIMRGFIICSNNPIIESSNTIYFIG